MRSALATASVALLVLLAPGRAAALGEIPTVFFVSKSQNRNEVHYALEVDRDCRPWTLAPVHPYWLMREKGNATEPLLQKELRAYGIKEQKVDGATVRVSLSALPAREIVVSTSQTPRGACQSTVTTVISGTPARLFNIHVSTTPLGASAESILLTGWRDDGTLVRERIKL